MPCRLLTHGQTDGHTDRVTTVGTLSGFQDFILLPIIKDRPNIPLIATPFLRTDKRALLRSSTVLVAALISITSKSIGAPAYLQGNRYGWIDVSYYIKKVIHIKVTLLLHIFFIVGNIYWMRNISGAFQNFRR